MTLCPNEINAPQNCCLLSSFGSAQTFVEHLRTLFYCNVQKSSESHPIYLEVTGTFPAIPVMTRWRLTHLTQKKSAGIHLEQRLVFQIPESFWTFMEKALSEWRWSLLSYVLLLFSWIPAFRQTLSPQVSPKGKIPKWGLAIGCILVLLGKENIQEYPHHCTGLYTLDPEVFLVNFLCVRESEPLHDISSHFHCFTADSLWHRAKFKNNLCDQGTLASTT